MKKICIDARMLKSAGIGTYLKNILPFIIEKYEPKLILRKQDFKSFSWIGSNSIIECNHPIYSIQEHFFFSRLPKFDLFWSPHFDSPYFPIKTRKRVVTIHDVFHLAFFSKLNWKEKIYAKLAYSNAVKKSDIIITDSKFSKNELTKYLRVNQKKIQVVPCAVNLEHFKKSDSAKSILKKYDLRRPFFLFVGNIKPHKNLQTLIKAHGNLIEKFDLVIIGKSKGLINSESIRLCDQQKRYVHILNSVTDKDLILFYQNAEAFIFPSFYEGFGLPVLESMAMGCPVIGSSAASIPEVGGDAMLYFDPKDPGELVGQMQRLVTNGELRCELIKKGHQRVRQFSWEESAKKHIELFEALL